MLVGICMYLCSDVLMFFWVVLQFVVLMLLKIVILFGMVLMLSMLIVSQLFMGIELLFVSSVRLIGFGLLQEEGGLLVRQSVLIIGVFGVWLKVIGKILFIGVLFEFVKQKLFGMFVFVGSCVEKGWKVICVVVWFYRFCGLKSELLLVRICQLSVCQLVGSGVDGLKFSVMQLVLGWIGLVIEFIMIGLGSIVLGVMVILKKLKLLL